jgi:endonuclease/exonuclease/phosphatase family metal-dependent hydrolase
MIFYSDELVALDSYVSSTHGASDHMPVLATLAWRSP